MPQIIEMTDDMDIELARQKCVNGLTTSATEVKRFNARTALYLLKTNEYNGYYFLASNTEIDYFVEYKRVELSENVLPVKFGVRQILIHRFPTASAYATGIGADIFWNELLKEFNCLISDSQQTEDGKKFWHYRVKEALDKKMTVRMINSNDNSYVDVNTVDELDELAGGIWTKSKWCQRIVLVIY